MNGQPIRKLGSEIWIDFYVIVQIRERVFFNLMIPKPDLTVFNRSSRRKRGMVSNPLFIIPDFFAFSKPKVAIDEFHLRVDAMPLSLKNLLLNNV